MKKVWDKGGKKKKKQLNHKLLILKRIHKHLQNIKIIYKLPFEKLNYFQLLLQGLKLSSQDY